MSEPRKFARPAARHKPSRSERLRRGCSAAVLAAVAALVVSACGAPPRLLNSERIEATYGNYAIEVVEATGDRRVADLYSVQEGRRTTRTWAEVRFVTPADPALRAEHERVLAGGSIGEVFESGGWEVSKRNICIGSELLDEAAGHIATRMRITTPYRVAVHEYAFVVAKEGREIEYAVIMERHHPDYLTEADLRAIYGTAPDEQ